MEEKHKGFVSYYTYYHPKKVKWHVKKFDIFLIILYLLAVSLLVVEIEPYHWDLRCLIARCNIAYPQSTGGFYGN